MSKAKKLYKDSPSIEKDEDGKPGIRKPSQADAEDMGLAGSPAGEGSEGEMPIQVHQKMTDMLERHQNELKDMQKRHSKEADQLHTKHKS